MYVDREVKFTNVAEDLWNFYIGAYHIRRFWANRAGRWYNAHNVSDERMTGRGGGAEARISAFAEKAAHAFSYCGSEDALEWVLQNWHVSVKPYFDAFIEDVRKTDVPLSTDYFSVDGIYKDVSNPIFTFLSPKMISSASSDTARPIPTPSGSATDGIDACVILSGTFDLP